jgi:hypothetical protein
MVTLGNHHAGVPSRKETVSAVLVTPGVPTVARANIKYAKAKNSGALPQQEIDEFYKQFDQVLMDEHRLWMTVRAARDQAARHERSKH